MDSWVVNYNSIDNCNNLLYECEVIQGKNAMDALLKRFGKQFVRLTGERGRYADVILIKGTFENNTIKYSGRYTQLCYGIIASK